MFHRPKAFRRLRYPLALTLEGEGEGVNLFE
jgi:hypothetical protein